MRIPKRYGESKVDSCPFCGKQATTKNPQRIPVCEDHKDDDMPNMKCLCGEYLDLKIGKFGPFYSCMRCGTMNMGKAMEMNPNAFSNSDTYTKKEKVEKSGPELVDPDDPRYFD